jgi:ADP-ribose pyrophosphatase
MGTSEPGADVAETARIELREETGLEAGRIEFIATMFQGAGYSDQCGHVFLATELRAGPPAREQSEQGMVQRAMTLAEVEGMIAAGTLQDAMTLAALGMLRFRGRI